VPGVTSEFGEIRPFAPSQAPPRTPRKGAAKTSIS
jgi:hypothetical protein